MGRRYYADPTADMAIAHVMKEQKRKEKQKEKPQSHEKISKNRNS